MDDGAVIDFIDFGNGTNVAGAEEISFLCVLTLENECRGALIARLLSST